MGWFVTGTVVIAALMFAIGWQLKLRRDKRNDPPPEHSNAHNPQTFDPKEIVKAKGIDPGAGGYT